MKHLAVLITVIAAVPTVATLATFAAPVQAQQAGPAEAVAQGGSGALTEGEVRRIDKDAKKITLRHGPLKNLDMPAMTMVFQVKDAAMLERFNVGDKVKFNAEKIPGGYAVTHLEAAK